MSLIVRVFAPTGRDAELIVALLRQDGLSAEPCSDLPALLAELGDQPIGPLLIAEESLRSDFVRQLAALSASQPDWSDLALLVLTSSGREDGESRRLAQERLPIGSPVLLERPIRTATLLSSVHAAVRARSRQYQVRDTLAERDRALEALNQERETLQVVLDNLPVGVVLAQPTGEIILGNQSVATILRRPVPTDAQGWVIFHADGSRLLPQEFPLARALESGHALPPEDFLCERGDGSRAWVRLAAAPVIAAGGRVIGCVIALSDIDQQKQADELLRRSEERIRRLIENASVGVHIGDADGNIFYMNPTLLRLLGYSADEVQARSVRWQQITPSGWIESNLRALEELRSSGTATPYQTEYKAKDGRRIPLLLGAIRIPSSGSAAGSAIGTTLDSSPATDEIAVFVTDLTTQKQAEAALIQSEKIAAVGRLAASISHEINNPLEAVINLLYLARTSDDLDQVRRQISQADAELARVSQIVTQSLRFHRQSTRARTVAPDALVDSALALYRGRLANSQIVVERETRGSAQVTCFESDIRQVLNNLLGNAVDAMRQGGRLLIRTSSARRWRSDTRGIRITIADTGHGMPAAVRARIFQAFYTTKGNNGTGLGLWISDGIVQKHGGLLQVRSRAEGEAGTGTVFSLFLP